MASKSLITTLALFLVVNLLFFNLAAAKAGGCPKDDLEIGLCASIINADNLKIGASKLQQCCSLVNGLKSDNEVKLCLCAAFRGSVPGIDHNTSKNIDTVLKACGKKNPPKFHCPS